MTFATRMILILLLALPLAGRLAAQETTTSGTTEPTTAAAGEPRNETATAATPVATATDHATLDANAVTDEQIRQTSYERRNRFTQLLREYPSDVAAALVLEPTLLSNEEYLSHYPTLQRFVAANPEVARHPRFYLSGFTERERREDVLESVLEPIITFAAVALVTFALGWFIRTLIEQRRWSRLTRTQTEVHTKILDRFGTSTEVLEYIKTPAGTKFLESAPIALHAEPPRQNTPFTRGIWTVQAGVILLFTGLGMMLISARYPEGGQGLFALGAIALSIGGGFIASAAVSLFLSRRLGNDWQSPGAPEPASRMSADRLDVS